MKHPARPHSTSITVTTLGAALMLAGCAASAGAGSDEPVVGFDGPIPHRSIPAGEVLGQGTVLQKSDEAAQFCLGPVAESYPPQCSGPTITPWDWSTVELSETSKGVTWGTYAVQGTWDGTTFAPTQPAIPLALYDPMPIPDSDAPAEPGTLTEAELTTMQDELHNAAGESDDDALDLVSSAQADGRLTVDVLYDDGALQGWLDGRYGTDAVIVNSVLRDVG